MLKRELLTGITIMHKNSARRVQLDPVRAVGAIATDPNIVAQTILQECQIAYAFTDCSLRIIGVNDPQNVVPEYHQNGLGRLLTETVPELKGYEETLIHIVTGDLAHFQISRINRVRSDDQIAYLAMLFLPYRDQAGRIVGLLHIVQDVTEVGSLEQELTRRGHELLLACDQLAQQNARLAASNAEFQRLGSLKPSFASIAAHELRTPLTSVMGYLELLSGGDAGPLNDQQTDYLKTIEDAARRLLYITNDLLDAARLEAGRLDLTLQPFDLSTLIASVVAEQAAQLEAKSQHISLQTPARLPLALCDVTRAGQIIGNLLNNARKFSPPDTTIVVRLSEAADPGYLQVSVTNRGTDIPAENHVAIFQPFGRVDSAAANGVDGVGLGLFIARSLASLHGGRIWIESLPDEGTTFHVSFPIADQASP
jgi:signal transduction histidine kinase